MDLTKNYKHQNFLNQNQSKDRLKGISIARSNEANNPFDKKLNSNSNSNFNINNSYSIKKNENLKNKDYNQIEKNPRNLLEKSRKLSYDNTFKLK